ncbi:Trp biosynthesis-associated membrane protein [Thermomonospora catenispora]|uniref:Trp biosynthesis-associated membrane protein n=1 Tax=Thermomonospora catenispora TaxID=2493090 RepID=UPI00112488E8|nr:Trp biosynthesis-associated membrane protein [Thermomonospora catenispora]TNY34891.1 MFS transporter [Thermomonospora catenispora]
MDVRRERAGAVSACAAGAGLVLLAAGRQWASVRAHGAITPIDRTLTGNDLTGAVSALGWAGLAALAALVAARGRARVAVGALLVLLGAAAAAAAAAAVRRPHVLAAAEERSTLLRLGSDLAVTTTGWWTVAATGGVLLAAAGLLTALRGHRWPGMSARYDRPGAGRAAQRPAPDDPAGLWKSLDRGEDPTARDE